MGGMKNNSNGFTVSLGDKSAHKLGDEGLCKLKNILKSTDLYTLRGFPGGSVVKNPPAYTGDAGGKVSFPVLGRSPGGGNGNSLLHSMDRGA